MSVRAFHCGAFLFRSSFGVVTTVLILGSAGCAAGGQAGDAGPRTVRLDLDPAKAYLSLDEIEPRIARPKRPDNLPTLPERAAQPIAASRRLVAEQRYTEAALELERALRYAPNHPQIHEALALLHWQAGNLERAKSHATQALETNPESATARYIVGRCRAAAGDKQGALAEFRTALLCGGFGADAEVAALCHFHLAETLAAEGYLTAALRQYEAFGRQATASPPPEKSELLSLLATRRGSATEARSRVLEKLGRFDEAAAALGSVVAATSDDVALQTRYARLLSSAGRYDAAASAVRAIPSDDDAVISLLFEIHERAGHPERVIDDLRARVAARPEAADLILRLADVLVRLNRADEAHAELGAFLDHHPDADAVRQKLIDTLILKSKWAEALRLCAAGVRRESRRAGECEAVVAALAKDGQAATSIIASAASESGDGVYQYLCGRVAAAAGQTADAQTLLRNALRIDGKFVPARVALADLLLRSCDYDKALQIAHRADADTPEDARLERVLGRVHERLDDTEKAELHYRAATQLDRTDSESMFALANIYRRTRRTLQAQRQLRVLLDADSGNEKARELLALALLEDGKADAALQEYQQLQKITKKPTTIARCRALLDTDLRKDPAARRKLLLDAVAEGGADAPTLIAAAETYEDTDPQKCREFFAQASALDADAEEAALGVVRADQHLLDLEQAAEGLERLLQCRPNQHAWRRALFGYFGLLGQYDRALTLAREQEARTDLNEAQRSEYRDAIVEMLRESGRRDEAIAQLQSWSKSEPDNQEWTRRIADEFVRQRRYAEAVPLHESLYRGKPQDAAIRERLLETLREAGRHVRAEQYLLDWFNEDAENDRLMIVLAHTLADGGRLDDALDLIYTSLPHTLHREMFQDLLVGELAAAGRHDECVEFLDGLSDELLFVLRSGRDGVIRIPQEQLTDERRSRRPDEPYSIERLHDRFENLRLRRIVAMTNAKRFRDAEGLLNDILDAATDPQLRMKLLYSKSALLRAQDRRDEADDAMKSVLAMRPNDESLSNDLAYNWIDRGIHLDEAERLIRYAVGRIPRQAAFLDTYGWLLYKMGDFAGAEVWLSRANRVRGGDDPVIHDHLGDANWRMGRRTEAIENWKKAAELIHARRKGEFTSDDERRVRDATPKKIEDAVAGMEPGVASLATPQVNGKTDRPAESN